MVDTPKIGSTPPVATPPSEEATAPVPSPPASAEATVVGAEAATRLAGLGVPDVSVALARAAAIHGVPPARPQGIFTYVHDSLGIAPFRPGGPVDHFYQTLISFKKLFDSEGLQWFVSSGGAVFFYADATSNLRPPTDVDLVVIGQSIDELLKFFARKGIRAEIVKGPVEKWGLRYVDDALSISMNGLSVDVLVSSKIERTIDGIVYTLQPDFTDSFFQRGVRTAFYNQGVIPVAPIEYLRILKFFQKRPAPKQDVLDLGLLDHVIRRAPADFDRELYTHILSHWITPSGLPTGSPEDDVKAATDKLATLALLPPPTVQTVPGEATEIIPGISNAHLRQIFFDHGREIRLNPGDVLIEEGGRGDAVYLLLEGTLQVHIPSGFDILRAGSIVGEIAVLEDRPRTATVSAQSEVRLIRLDDVTFRRFISSRTRQGVQELANERKEEAWPAVIIHGDPVHLINVDEKYAALFTRMMSEDNIRNQIFSTIGIKATDEIKVEDIQFGGRGSIKYVVRLEVKVNGVSKVIGIRFYETRLFRNAEDTSRSARAEVAEFQAFEKERAAAIHIEKYLEAGKDFDDADLLFVTSGVAGFSVGEFIVIDSSDLVGDTGVRLEHLSDLAATVVEAWLLRQGQNSERPEMGPIIGDLKLENFVLNWAKGEIQYIDLGDVAWVGYDEMVTWLDDFFQKGLGDPSEEKRVALREGIAKGHEAYERKKGGGSPPGTGGAPFGGTHESALNVGKSAGIKLGPAQDVELVVGDLSMTADIPPTTPSTVTRTRRPGSLAGVGAPLRLPFYHAPRASSLARLRVW